MLRFAKPHFMFSAHEFQRTLLVVDAVPKHRHGRGRGPHPRRFRTACPAISGLTDPGMADPAPPASLMILGSLAEISCGSVVRGCSQPSFADEFGPCCVGSGPGYDAQHRTSRLLTLIWIPSDLGRSMAHPSVVLVVGYDGVGATISSCHAAGLCPFVGCACARVCRAAGTVACAHLACASHFGRGRQAVGTGCRRNGADPLGGAGSPGVSPPQCRTVGGRHCKWAS